MERTSLFENLKLCSVCQRMLPDDFEEEVCPICQENQLFGEVKEYIRSKDVNEYQVAEHFNLSRAKVRKWIKDGRIEYKESENKIVSVFCRKCGAPITFGTLCEKCHKKKFQEKSGYAAYQESNEDNKMRFLEDDSSFKERMKNSK